MTDQIREYYRLSHFWVVNYCYMEVKSTISLKNGAQVKYKSRWRSIKLNIFCGLKRSVNCCRMICQHRLTVWRFSKFLAVLLLRPSTGLWSVECKVKYQVIACGICGGQCSTTTGFSLSAAIFFLSVSFHCVPYKFIHLPHTLCNLSNWWESLNNAIRHLNFSL